MITKVVEFPFAVVDASQKAAVGVVTDVVNRASTFVSDVLSAVRG
jgi:hypothetical protein